VSTQTLWKIWASLHKYRIYVIICPRAIEWRFFPAIISSLLFSGFVRSTGPHQLVRIVKNERIDESR
jgi:hypothetical protein